MSTKKFCLSIFATLVAIILCISIFVAPTTVVRAANSNWEDIDDWGFDIIEVANGSFDNHSGELPASPTSWQETTLSTNQPSSEIVKSGVIELTNSSYSINRDNYALDDYFDENTFPQTLLDNKSALLINTNGLTTAFGYKSDEIVVTPYSHYKLSIYVRTGDFDTSSGATISLLGLKDSLNFVNISTYDPLKNNAQNSFNWQRYEFLFQTATYSSIKLQLSVGQGSDDESVVSPNNTARGWAMFADVNLQQLSPLYYSNQITSNTGNVDSSHVQVNDKSIDILGRIGANFVYDPLASSLISSQPADNIAHKTGAYIAPLVSNGDINRQDWDMLGARTTVLDASWADSSNNFGLTSNYRSPDFVVDRNVLLMSTFNPKINEFDERAIQATIKDVTILRHEYYMLSIWMRQQSVSDGIGAFVHITGQNNIASDNWELEVTKNNIEPLDSDAYGWNIQNIYIKGSNINDRKINITIGLGDGVDGLAKGNLLITNPRMYSITASQYETLSADQTQVTFDPTPTDNKIANSSFDNVLEQEVFEYPLVASDWTRITPDSANTNGWSSNTVSTSRALHGVVPTAPLNTSIEDPWVMLNRRGIIRPTDHPSGRLPDNLMLISSTGLTAYGFRSNSITLSASTPTAIQATLLANTKGYGANLILRKGNNIISNIERIDTNGRFVTYTFFVNPNLDISDVTVEVWLGLGDTVGNNTKLSSGYVFVDSIQEVEFASAIGTTGHNLNNVTDFDSLNKHYTNVLHNALVTGDFPNYNVYTEATNALFGFDRYDNNNLRTLTNWTHSTRGGNAIVDSTTSSWGAFDIDAARGNNIEGGTGLIPTNWVRNTDTADNAPKYIQQNGLPNYVHSTKNADNQLQFSEQPFVLMLRHSQPTASKLSSNVKFATDENSYYKLSVKLNADLTALTEDSIGLGIELAGTGFKFEDIRDTRDISYKDNPEYKGWWSNGYKEYIFYVKTTTQIPELSIDITLGGSGHSREYALGTVYINDISFETIEPNDFETAISNDIDYEEYFEHRLENRIFADIERGVPGPPPETDTDTGLSPINWALAPAVIFAIFLVLFLFIIIINGLSKKADPKIATAKQPKKVDYDRADAVLKSVGQAPIVAITEQDVYNLFDDDALSNNYDLTTYEDPSLEYEEIEYEEVIEVVVEDEDIVENSTQTSIVDNSNIVNDSIDQSNELNQAQEDDQIAVIQQLDEQDDIVDDAPKVKTIKQTVIKTKRVPKKVQKVKNTFQDSFDE
jgi:hypothetical protein